MKKIVTLFLLSIFLFNTVGYFIAFEVVQSEIKNEIDTEIKEKINSPELIAIVINKLQLSETKWSEDGKEMYYDDKFYDVVRHTENATSITYYCINDKEEETLFANLEDHINTQIAANTPTKNQKKSVDNVIKLYFSNELSTKFNIISFTSLQFYPTNLTYKSLFIETDFPPPKFV